MKMPPEPTTPTPSLPTPSSNRIVAIDALRGFALFGILLVNAAFFAMPLGISMAPTSNIASGGDLFTALLIKVFVEMKFISIFSLLFGVGLAIQRERAIARGRGFFGFVYRRLGVLALFGIFHALLLWYGDILFLYACIGSLMVLLLPCSARTLFIIGACLLLTSTLLISAFTFITTLFEQPIMPTGEPLAFQAPAPRGLDAIIEADLNPRHPTWHQAEIVAYSEGPFLDALAFRSVSWGFYLIVSMFTMSGYIAGMFLIGAALWKSGFFKGTAPSVAWRKPILLLGLGIGLPLSILSTSIQHFTDAPGWMALSATTQFLGAACIALGLVSLFMILGEAGILPGARGFAAVGRMSLSVYLLETIAFVTITSHWGFGAFGTFSHLELFCISIAIYAVILLLSIAWQRQGWIGPAEWLWRTLAYTRSVEWKTRPIRGSGDAS